MSKEEIITEVVIDIAKSDNIKEAGNALLEISAEIAASQGGPGGGHGGHGGDCGEFGIVIIVVGAVTLPLVFTGQALYDMYNAKGWKNKAGWGVWALLSGAIGAGVGYVAGPAVASNFLAQTVASSFFGGGTSLASYNLAKLKDCCTNEQKSVRVINSDGAPPPYEPPTFVSSTP